jgi:hypothetical protein
MYFTINSIINESIFFNFSNSIANIEPGKSIVMSGEYFNFITNTNANANVNSNVNSNTNANHVRFVKWINPTMGNRGYYFNDGLNIDKNEFDPMSECANGIYFCSFEQKNKWKQYNNVCFYVSIPNDAIVMIYFGLKIKTDKIIIGPRCDDDNVEITTRLRTRLFGNKIHYLESCVNEDYIINFNYLAYCLLSESKKIDIGLPVAEKLIKINPWLIIHIPFIFCVELLKHDGLEQYLYPIVTTDITKYKNKNINFNIELLWMIYISKFPMGIKKIEKEIETQEIANIAVNGNILAYQFILPEHRTREMAELVINSIDSDNFNFYSVKLIPSEHLDTNSILKLINKHNFLIHNENIIDSTYLTQEIVNNVIINDSSSYFKLKDKFKTLELSEKILLQKNSFHIIPYVPLKILKQIIEKNSDTNSNEKNELSRHIMRFINNQ